MGDGNRTASLDLLFENGDNGAIGTKHVTEACRHETGMSFNLSLSFSLVKTLDVNLTDTL